MTVAAAGTALEVASKVKSKRPKVKLKSPKAGQKAVATSMGVIIGSNALKFTLVDKKAPPFSYWIRIAFLGFGLAVMHEISPKLGKPMAYLVMTSVVFKQAGDIVKELEALEQEDKKKVSTGPGEIPLSLAAVRTEDRQPFMVYFERGNTQLTETILPKKNTPFIDPQRGSRRPAPIPYRGSTTYA